MASEKVRVRFAPSPTGPLHIGGVRTALYNYLFAKKYGGDFILRIEDTDQSRFVEGAEDYIINSLNWCKIPFDEGPGKEKDFGPYRQSERADLYHEYSEKLIDSGNAYYAFDTNEELDKHRKEHEEKGKTFIYNWHNRKKLKNSLSLSPEEVQKRISEGENYVIRFKAPEDQNLHLFDEIRGKISVETNILDDKILFKSDGLPTYHLANVVDDHLMKISHVIRGEEWLPSLPLHFLLYKALGWTPPKFAHLPLILKPQGKGKLSKRDGEKMGFPVFPLNWKDPKNQEEFLGYKEAGYFPETVINMLALLGWNEGKGSEKEIYSLGELIEAFSLEHVSKGGSKFDPEKTKWFQHQILQQKSVEELSESFLKSEELKVLNVNKDYVQTVISLLKERATFVDDFWHLGWYFFKAPAEYDQKALKKAWKEGSTTLMQDLLIFLEARESFDPESLKEETREWINSKEVGFGKVMQPFRIALVGSMQGPDVFEVAATIGKTDTLKRLKNLIQHRER